MEKMTKAVLLERDFDKIQNPYVNKVYKCSTIKDVEEPTLKPERSVESSLCWLRDSFSKAVLLLPEDWKVRLCQDSKTEG